MAGAGSGRGARAPARKIWTLRVRTHAGKTRCDHPLIGSERKSAAAATYPRATSQRGRIRVRRPRVVTDSTNTAAIRAPKVPSRTELKLCASRMESTDAPDVSRVRALCIAAAPEQEGHEQQPRIEEDGRQQLVLARPQAGADD